MSEKPTLLVVDDEELIIELLTDLFEDDFTVVTASNGMLALKALREFPAIQGVITDLHMPLLNGVELVKEIRQIYPNLPVLGLSGTLKSSRESFFQGIPFLQKPFEVTELLILARRLFQPDAH